MPPRTVAPPRPEVVPQPDDAWPRREVLDLALLAYGCAEREGRFRRPVLTIIDYSLPASRPRLWVIDLSGNRVLHHEHVAHGMNSGGDVAVAFSNRIGSYQSSLGLFRTDEVYTGRYGYSLRLSGLEPGINDNARARGIVVHAASYVGPSAVAQWGTIGTTLGCPALAADVTGPVIDGIAGGSALFAYYPDAAWLGASRYLHCDEPLAGGRVAARH